MKNRELHGYPGNILELAATYVNSELSKGKSAYRVLSLIRAFPQPIVVDFNNVIANNTDPLRLNPDAPEFLEELRKIGTVFIVTAAGSWTAVQEFLAENEVWSPVTVLLTKSNYRFMEEPEGHQEHHERSILIEDFLKRAKKLGWNLNEGDLVERKRVAPIFGKSFLVPIIDDFYHTTHNNPGTLGIQVNYWEPNLTEDGRKWLDEQNRGTATLKEAVEMVRNHYSSLGLSSMTSEAVK